VNLVGTLEGQNFQKFSKSQGKIKKIKIRKNRSFYTKSVFDKINKLHEIDT